MKTPSLLIGAVIIVIIVGGVLVLSKGTSNPSAEQHVPAEQMEQATTSMTTESTTTVSRSPSSAPSGKPNAPKSVTVTYDGSSFSPSTITVNVGDKVTFVDSSNNPMWVASAMHPTHTAYDGTNTGTHCAPGYSGPAPFDECKASTASYSFTFTKAGTWPYHNHVSAGAFGKVVVQ